MAQWAVQLLRLSVPKHDCDFINLKKRNQSHHFVQYVNNHHPLSRCSEWFNPRTKPEDQGATWSLALMLAAQCMLHTETLTIIHGPKQQSSVVYSTRLVGVANHGYLSKEYRGMEVYFTCDCPRKPQPPNMDMVRFFLQTGVVKLSFNIYK